MDSDSDESYEQESHDGDDKSDHLVMVKPHFEGKAGEEVFVVLFEDFVATWNLHVQPYVSRACAISQVNYMRLIENFFNIFVAFQIAKEVWRR